MSDNKEKPKNEIDVAFDRFEEACSSSTQIRKELINQLRKQIVHVEISPFDKPMLITAKLEIAKTLDGLLKSDEDVNFKLLKAKLQRKDGETNGMVGAAIVGLLKQLRVDGTSENPEQNKAALDQAKQALEARIDNIKKDGGKEAAALEVSEGELVECSSVMTVERPPDEPEGDE